MTVEFWFDFASPYSYLAAERVGDVVWRPFLLGPIFQAQLGFADSPFNRNPARGRYLWRDLERQAARFALPLRRPSQFPRNSVLAARVACVALDEPWGVDFARRVFRANFADDRDLADPAVIASLVPDPEILERATAGPNRDRLRRATEEALRRGVFGAPTFFAGDEMFFGNDRLDEAVAWAGRSITR